MPKIGLALGPEPELLEPALGSVPELAVPLQHYAAASDLGSGVVDQVVETD